MNDLFEFVPRNDELNLVTGNWRFDLKLVLVVNEILEEVPLTAGGTLRVVGRRESMKSLVNGRLIGINNLALEVRLSVLPADRGISAHLLARSRR